MKRKLTLLLTGFMGLVLISPFNKATATEITATNIISTVEEVHVQKTEEVQVYQEFDFKLTVDGVTSEEFGSTDTTILELINEVSAKNSMQFYYGGSYETPINADSHIVLTSDINSLSSSEDVFLAEEFVWFDTTVVNDPTLPLGEEYVEYEGNMGLIRVSYENTVDEDGNTHRNILDIDTLLNAENRIVCVGTGANVDVTRWNKIVEERRIAAEKSAQLAKEIAERIAKESANNDFLASEDVALSEVQSYKISEFEKANVPDVQLSNSLEVFKNSNSIVSLKDIMPDLFIINTGDSINVLNADDTLVPIAHTYNMEATAYSCEGYVGKTASGTIARVGAVAVDPSFIPLGTKLYIEGYGFAIAEDTGGVINKNKIDLYFNTEAECIQFGRREIVVHILD